ncbi:chromatin remodeling protein, putative [Plasmodium malariae]|uniref:Chromatin remodeling protein, putative n=1 Tax=Plasmodium malariae TaxID=5858 RepID=A0A1C3KC45_PLAMA|nr:chromatin remodeling protein, putative [Plasmodium malariae]
MFRNVREYFKGNNEKNENSDNVTVVDNNKNNVNNLNDVNNVFYNEDNYNNYLDDASYKGINGICREEKVEENNFKKNYESYNDLDNAKKAYNASGEENNKNKDHIGKGLSYENNSSLRNNFPSGSTRIINGNVHAPLVNGDNKGFYRDDDNNNNSNYYSNDDCDGNSNGNSNGNSKDVKNIGNRMYNDEGIVRSGLSNDKSSCCLNENGKKEMRTLSSKNTFLKRRKLTETEETSELGEANGVIKEGENKKDEAQEIKNEKYTKSEIPNEGIYERENSSTELDSTNNKDIVNINNVCKNNNDSGENEEKVNYLQDKLELLLSETKRFTEKLSGQRLKVNTQSKSKKSGRCAMTEKEEDYMLLKDANEDDESFIIKQPNNINGCMKPYQIEGLNWLYQLYRHKINGILADEMGLGKTLQTISLLCYLRFNKNIKRKSIIICPRSTLDNWYEEIKKWCSEMKALKYYGNKEQRKELNKKVLHTDYDVLLTTYEIVIKDKCALYDIDWFFLVIDEAHRIKNDKSVLSSSVRFLKSENRLLITGTPLHNNLKELWSLLNFLMPKIFDNSEEFDNLFNISKISTNDNKQSEIITQLHTILKPFMLRRLKVEVEQSLPPKREIYIFVGMSKLQKKLYSDILSKNIDVINAMTGSKNQMLNILMQLRKCCNHPYLFDGIEEPPYIEGNHLIETSGKMSLLDKLLPRLKKENSRVLLFSQMTRLLDIIDDYCRWKNYEYLRIDGSTVGDERQIRINQFNEPNSKYFIFLLSTRAGGIGINLTTADIVILFDSDYNPQMDIQAMDRAHRIGQKKRVIVYRFVTQNSVEEKIVERAAKKLKLDSLIIQKGKLNLNMKENNKQELHNILNFGAPEVYKTQDISSISDEDIDIILADAEKRTLEIENKLKSLENIFDLSNISLDGGLNMYNDLDKDGSGESSYEECSDSVGVDGKGSSEGNNLSGVKKKGKNINKIRSTIKKFLKNNKKNMTFLDLGERKSKWKVMNTAGTRTNKKKMVLHGWRAEARGGHDFQFFNNEKLDELEKIEERWNIHRMNEQKVKDIIEAQAKKENFEKIINFSDFLDIHAKDIYDIINLTYPTIFEEYNNEEEEEDEEDHNINDNNLFPYNHNHGSATTTTTANNYHNSKNNYNHNHEQRNVKNSTGCSDNSTEYFKGKILRLMESRKKLNMIKFRDKNVKSCFDYIANFIKRHLGETNNDSGNSKKNKKNKKKKKKGDDDISNIDIEKVKSEKQELLKEGFSKWNKAEYNKLMNGLIIYGCDEIEYIYEKYFRNSKKSMEDIRAYLRVFFRKYNQVKGGIRLFDKIQKSDMQRQLIQEENDLIANFVEKQLSEGVDAIDKLELPSNLSYDYILKPEDTLYMTEEVKEEKEKEKNNSNDEEILYYKRENKILLWLLYQEGVVQIKNIHILTPYYWSEAYNFFKYASTPLENIEYRCRLIVDAIVEQGRRNTKVSSTKEKRKT